MSSPQTILIQRVKISLILALITSAPLLLSAAESLGLSPRRPKPQRTSINFSGPTESAELPGPDRLEAPPSRFSDSLKPNTSYDPIAPPYLPSRRDTPKRLPDLQKDWLLGPSPNSQKEKDAEINKFFGIREYNYDQIEKSGKSSRAEWLVDNSAQRRKPQQPRNKPKSDGSDPDSEKEEKRARVGDHKEDRFGAANRHDSGYKGLFDSATSEKGDSSSESAALGQSSSSLRDLLGTGVNPLRDRKAQAGLEEFRKIIDSRPANSPFGASEPLAARLDSPRPVPPAPPAEPNLGATESDRRRATFDPAEFSGSGTRYRAPLFDDLNKKQFGILGSSPEAKPKTDPGSWFRPPVLEIPRRKF